MSGPAVVRPITQVPRARLLLKLLNARIGEWVSSRDAAEACGDQHAVYVEELKSQGRPISTRIEYHGAEKLTWYRLNRTSAW